MAPPRSYHCEALTLKHIPIGEADLLVTLLTRDRGKLRAVAKGARRTNSKMVGHLEPLTQVRLSLAQGRNLDYITQVQVLGIFTPLITNLEAISQGFYVAELLDGFASEASPNQPLYHLAVATLHSIAEDPDPELALRFFELKLLHVSGFMPELYRCVECRRDLAPGHHRFSPSVGGTLCLACRPTNATIRPLSLGALKVLRLLDRSGPQQTPRLRLDPALGQELKTLLRATLENWLDKQIQSTIFLDQLGRESKPEVYT